MDKIELTQSEISIISKYFPNGLMALDLETSGLSPMVNEIIEIAAIKVKDNKVTTYETLVKPKNSIPQVTIDIHGITDDMVKDSPALNDVLPQFLEFSSDTPWVAHNAKFDIGFIVYSLHHGEYPFSDIPVYCSCKLSRKYIKGSENHKLSTLAKFYNIDLVNHHRALDDTWACMKVFAQTLSTLEDERNLKDGYISNIKDFDKNLTAEIPKKILGIDKYLENQTPIEIKYKGGSLKGKFRPIKPVSLLPMPQGNVLYAHCLLSDLYKSFSLLKIQEFRELKNKEEE